MEQENNQKICGKPCDVYSRITGYHRPIKNWNEGKVQEFKDRKSYDMDGIQKKIQNPNGKESEQNKFEVCIQDGNATIQNVQGSK